jgi:glycosyltransferase involved in cell wall biosynthesis
MIIIKKILKFTFCTFDNILYFFWRLLNRSRRDNKRTYKYKPLISIVVPIYNTDYRFLKNMIESVKKQLYTNWELLLVDDSSTDEGVRTIIKDYTATDERIKYSFLERNYHIAGATNIGISSSKGEYIGLLDHDDILYKNALLEIVKVINQNPEVKFIYTDEDKVIGNRRTQPFFKPSWNLSLLHCVNYITHFSVIKKETLDKVGYEDGDYNGAQDWELFLRVGRNVSEKEIVHIPLILYGWRMHSLSTSVNMDVKPYVLDAQIKAVEQDLKLRGLKNVSVERDKKYSGQLSIDQNRGVRGLRFQELRSLLGTKRALFIFASTRMALTRHIYRTTTYDRLV